MSDAWKVGVACVLVEGGMAGEPVSPCEGNVASEPIRPSGEGVAFTPISPGEVGEGDEAALYVSPGERGVAYLS